MKPNFDFPEWNSIKDYKILVEGKEVDMIEACSDNNNFTYWIITKEGRFRFGSVDEHRTLVRFNELEADKL